MPLGYHADERDPKVWRTVASNLPPAAAGSFPPAAMPEEITSGHPERLRAVLVSACNPLRAYPDTAAYERAFSELDLLVVNDIVMSETARLAHYVLPCRSFYESWDGTFFPNTYPEVYFQMRRPLVEPPEQCKEASQIYHLLAKELGLVPRGARGAQVEGGQGQPPGLWHASSCSGPRAGARSQESHAALGAGRDPGQQEWDSAALAGLWGMLMTAPKAFAARARSGPGFRARPGPGRPGVPGTSWTIPRGCGSARPTRPRPGRHVRTDSGKLEVFIPELADETEALSSRGRGPGPGARPGLCPWCSTRAATWTTTPTP